MKFKIASEIFAKWPEVKIGVVAAFEVDNQKNTPSAREILQYLRQQEAKIPARVGDTPVGQLPRVAPWRQVYKDFGVTGGRYKSSVESLLRRAKAGKALPVINPLVNLYNALSLKHRLPFGGEDLAKVQGDIVLKVCDGTEKGVYIGGKDEVACKPGEVAYCDDVGFICRRWNWREAERTKLTPETKSVVLVAEAMPPAGANDLKLALEELADFLSEKLGGRIHGAILDRNKPEFEIDDGKYTSEVGESRQQVGRNTSEVETPQKKSARKFPPMLETKFSVGLQEQVEKLVKKAVADLDLDGLEVEVSHPGNPNHGDFMTNIALVLFSQDNTPGVKSADIPGVEGSSNDTSDGGKVKVETSTETFDSSGVNQVVKTPLDLAKKIQSAIDKQQSPVIRKVEVAPPGFVNFWLSDEAVVSQVRQVLRDKDNYGKSAFLKDKTILLEHTSPDPIKTIHIGHLRNNFLGMAMSRIFEAHSAQVTLDCINNDRGTHVCRAMFGYLAFGRQSLEISKQQLLEFKVPDEKVKEIAAQVEWRQVLDDWLAAPGEWYQPADLGLKSDHLNLIFYSLGDRSEKLVPGVKNQVREILKDWEEERPKVRALWRQIIDWSLSGYAVTYKRINSRHDKVWYESNLYQGGKQLVKQGLERGVFVESKGAIVTDLAEYSLPDTVVIKSDGTALYLTFDLNLTLKKRQAFSSDLYIWGIGNDQLLYMKQLFAVCEQLGIGRREDYYHLNYGYVALAGGQKMSSRQGTVITADELLDYLKSKARQIMVEVEKTSTDTPEVSVQDFASTSKVKSEDTLEVKNSIEEVNHGFTPKRIDQISEKVGQAAVKYALLKTNRNSDIHFDPETSVALSGDSGPYLQYTHARCSSVLEKAKKKKIIFSVSEYDLFRGGLAVLGRSLMARPKTTGRFPSSFPKRGGFAKPGQKSAFGSQKGGAKGFSGFPAPKPYSGAKKPAFTPKKGVGKAPPVKRAPQKLSFSLEKEEKTLLRTIYQYPEVMLESAKKIEPSLVCQFLYELAQKYNAFYNKHKILQPEDGEDKKESAVGKMGAVGKSNRAFSSRSRLARRNSKKDRVYFRLALTAAVAQILKNGLVLLGIDPLERM